MRQPRTNRHHPLFSPLAILGALILLGGLGLLVFRSGGQAFSPGALSAVSATGQQAGGFPNHAAFGEDCLACHTAFAGIEAEKCTSCHTEIAQQQRTGQGLHGQVVDEACTACHQEHEGAQVDLLALALSQFSAEAHDAFFVLDGAHATVGCESCHSSNNFAGTADACMACHEEPAVHAGLFGLECAYCHTTSGWENAQLRIHAFPLDHGQLGQLACAACHTATYSDFTCTLCHEPGFESRVEEIMARD